MTINVATALEVLHDGDGVTTSFATTFPFIAARDLQVALISGTTESAVGSFSITGGNYALGAVHLVAPPAVGQQVRIRRRTVVDQETDVQSNSSFPSEAVERALDKLSLVEQELAARIGALESGAAAEGLSAVNLGAGAALVAQVVGGQIQVKTLTAGAGVSFSSSATEVQISVSGIGGGLLAANNLSDVASAATARTNLGLGSAALLASAAVLQAANNLSDVGSRQTAVNNLTAVGAATNEHVLTKDTGTGNAVWKAVPAGGGGEANTMSLKTGATGVLLYAQKVGVDLQLKGLAVSTGLSQSVTANDVSYAINQAAALTWTGVETFDRVPTTGASSVIMKGNQVGEVGSGGVSGVDGIILDPQYYGALLDLRRTVDIAAAGQSSPGGVYGGNALIYGQMRIPAGTGGANGTAPVGMRMQMDVSYTSGGGGVNSPTAVYAGIHNRGVGLGAFGMHVDAYHHPSGGGTPSTYGMSVEMFGRSTTGISAVYVGRSDQAGSIIDIPPSKVDYGMVLVNANLSLGFKRGIQFGSPDLPGAAATTMDVGIDLTHATYAHAPIQIARDTYLILSGLAQAQSATPSKVCQIRYQSSGGGKFQVRNNTTSLFEVRADGTPALFGVATGSATAGAAGALPALPAGYTTIEIPGVGDKLVPYYNP